MAIIPSRPPGLLPAVSPTLSRVPGPSTTVTSTLTIPGNQPPPIWRQRLRLASYKSAPFYVDQQGRSSGRRVVVFEYPKRDLPYAEDMGRHAIRYQITGYLIQAPGGPRDAGTTYNGMDRDYDVARDRLENALMSPQPGMLVDPYNPRLFGVPGNPNATAVPADSNATAAWALPAMQVALAGYANNQPPLFICERYSIVESREKGGFCQVEMAFVEAGIPANMGMQASPQQVTNAAAATTSSQAAATDDAQTKMQDQDTDPSQAPVQVPGTPVPPGTIDTISI